MATKRKGGSPRNDEIIKYSLRPAKGVERKMICEALYRLSTLAPLSQYLYVGFGSTYFVDFSLFHRQLGIQNLISIEGEEEMESRVRFNAPYSCIEVIMGLSTDRLPQINWESQKSILWLDYVSSLKGYMFQDIQTFFNRANSGSVFLISINAEVKEDCEEGNQTNSDRIRKKLNQDKDVSKRIPRNLLEENLNKNQYYSILRDVIINEINSLLEIRNNVEDSKFEFKQIFNFIYHDGQAMLTIGGILFNRVDKSKIKNMAFENLQFYRNGIEPFEISVPHLTNREIQAIDKYLPKYNSDPKAKEDALMALKNIVSESAIDKYAKIYQYFPNYKEISL